MSLPPLEAKLVLDSTGFTKGISQAGETLNKFKGIIAAAGAAAAGFLAYKATDLIYEQMQIIDSTAKLADRLGMATEELTALQYAGDLAGVSSDQLQTSLTNLAKTMEDAGSGGKSAQETLAKLGTSYDELVTKTEQGKLEIIADGLAKIKVAGDRTAISMEAFGKTGAGMVNMLGDGSKGLRETTKEAKELGLTFSRFDAAKVEQANDSLARIGKIFDSVLIEAAIKFAGPIEAVSTELLNWIKSFGGVGKIAVASLTAVEEKMRPIALFFHTLALGWNTVKSFFSTAAGIVVLGLEKVSIAVGYLVSAFTYYLPDTIKFFGSVAKAVILSVGSYIMAVLGEGIKWAAGKIAEFTRFIANELRGSIITAPFANGIEKAGAAVDGFVKKNAMTLAEAATYTKDAWRDVSKSFAELNEKAGKSATESWLTTTLTSMKLKLADWMVESRAGVIDAWAGIFGDGSKAEQDLRAWFAKLDAISDEAARNTAKKAQDAINNKANAIVPPPVFEPQVNPITDGMLGAGMQEQLDSELSMNRAHLEAKAEQESWFTATFGREMEQRKTWEVMSNRERVASTQWMLGNFSTLMNSHSKKMFQIGKAAAIANAVISTAQGAAKALELGFPMGLIAMASVIAAGAVQISTIASTQFGGGGSVSSAGGNIALVGGEPSGVLATQAGVSGNARNELNVTISGLPDNAMVSGQFVRDLIQKINEAQADGSPILNVNMAAA